MTAALFVAGAGLGTAIRYLVNGLGFGWLGTLTVNVIGSFALGLLVSVEPGPTTMTVLGTGVLGSLTTFSSFALEATERPLAHRSRVIAASVVLGLAAASAGYALG